MTGKFGTRPDGTIYELAEPGSQFPIPWDKVDSPMIPLLKAMNRLPMVQTLECCCGHGKRHLWILFYAACPEALVPLLEAIHANDERRENWEILIEFLPKRGTIQYRLRTKFKGYKAYEEADRIAFYITEPQEPSRIVWRIERREV